MLSLKGEALSEEKRREIEAAVLGNREALRRKDDQSDDLDTHISPLRKAKEHIKHWVGGECFRL